MMLARVLLGLVLPFIGSLAACTVAQVSSDAGVAGVFALSSGRLAAIAAVLLGLTSMVSAGLSWARVPAGTARRRAMVAMVAGLTGMALAGMVVTVSAGGVGTGNGVGGAILGMGLGLIGVVLAGLVRARDRSA